MRRKSRRYNRIVIAMVLLLCIVMAAPSLASAITLDSITSDSIKDKQNQINQAEEEKQNLQDSLTDMKQVKKELEAIKSDLAKYVAQLDSNLEEIQQKIAELEQLIADKENEIATTQVQLDEAIATEEAQYDSMSKRIQFFYEEGASFYLELLFSGESFSDLINRADYIEQITSFDRQQLNTFMQNRELIELCKEQLEVEKELMDTAKAEVDQEKANIEDLITQKEQQITEYSSDINSKEKAIKEFEEEIAAQEAEIAELEAMVAAEKKQLLAASGVVITYDGGAFKFPLASYTRISDDYGWRIHPTLGVQQFHNGVDFASPSGTAIYAAYDGVVVASAYSATMGNYVMIDHGDGLYTIYMHASALYVSKDDIVVRGDKIAAVGSTGRSTGPHLHFSVRLNGEYVTPWNYLSQ